MSARRMAIALGCLAIAPNVKLAAQGLDELVAAARYEEAAASLQDASPEEARAGATQIFTSAYVTAFQEGRFTDAVRGFAAAKRVPHVEEGARQMFDFWHGMALFASVRDAPGGALGEEEASAVLEEARALLIASGDYPRRVNIPDAVANVEMLLEMSGRARARN